MEKTRLINEFVRERDALSDDQRPSIATLLFDGQESQIRVGPNLIGTAPLCDIRLTELGVSSIHAVILATCESAILVDLWATNQTIINNQQCDPAVRYNIQHSTPILFGPTPCTFLLNMNPHPIQTWFNSIASQNEQSVIAKQLTDLQQLGFNCLKTLCLSATETQDLESDNENSQSCSIQLDQPIPGNNE